MRLKASFVCILFLLCWREIFFRVGRTHARGQYQRGFPIALLRLRRRQPRLSHQGLRVNLNSNSFAATSNAVERSVRTATMPTKRGSCRKLDIVLLATRRSVSIEFVSLRFFNCRCCIVFCSHVYTTLVGPSVQQVANQTMREASAASRQQQRPVTDVPRESPTATRRRPPQWCVALRPWFKVLRLTAYGGRVTMMLIELAKLVKQTVTVRHPFMGTCSWVMTREGRWSGVDTATYGDEKKSCTISTILCSSTRGPPIGTTCTSTCAHPCCPQKTRPEANNPKTTP